MWTENEIHQYLKNVLKKERYEHTLGVTKSAEDLARRYGANIKKARLASLIHDVAKYKGNEEILSILKEENIHIDYVIEKNPQIMHGTCSAYIAKHQMGIEDEEVLNAITYHTTGRENMSLLEKIVYLADLIECGRDYPGVESLRKESIKDLDRALILSFDNTINFVIKRKGLVHLNTIKARNYLLSNI
ncbi:bis(5'-nucleosyl)-tetraphosphatase (symmetrical) YqeK [Hathewaya histolytica]|uniref:bis(5'-nucleosyl)-tetraphosphatase (symmetrical) YqeK n=1 Tax=Hathewaya histolytica TaxID=1498 RepID=UPI003B66CEA5